jgi:hypothetical protein
MGVERVTCVRQSLMTEAGLGLGRRRGLGRETFAHRPRSWPKALAEQEEGISWNG